MDSAGNEGLPTLWESAAVSGIADMLPSRFALHAAAPNPFNPMTTIAYELAETSPVRMVIYDLSGRVINILVDESSQARGRYEMIWNGTDTSGKSCATGVYLCRIVAG